MTIKRLLWSETVTSDCEFVGLLLDFVKDRALRSPAWILEPKEFVVVELERPTKDTLRIVVSANTSHPSEPKMILTKEQTDSLVRAASLVMEASFILRATGLDDLIRSHGYLANRGGPAATLGSVEAALSEAFSKITFAPNARP